MIRLFILTLSLLGFLSTTVLATEQKNQFIYAPASCEFQIIFPEKFFKAQKCDNENNCYDVISFALKDKDSNVDFRVTCLPKTNDEIKILRSSDLKAAVRDLAVSSGLRPMGDDVATMPDNVISAVAIALGFRGTAETIYTGQLWVGDKSLMTLEAEMRGPPNKKIETIYTKILESVKRK